MNISNYLLKHRITLEMVRDNGIQIEGKGDSKWEHHSYTVALVRPANFDTGDQADEVERRVELPYKMGLGHEGKVPEADEVFDSVVSDASAYIDARDFEDFAADFGYDSDIRTAERIYFACGEMAKKLEAFLGSSKELDKAMELERL